MRLAGAVGVSVDTQSTYASAPAALDRLVYAEDQRFITSTEMSDQKQRQYTAELKGREDCTAENVTVLCEAAVVAKSHDTES